MFLLSLVSLPDLDPRVGGAGVDAPVDGRHDNRVDRVVVGVPGGLQALEIRRPPHLEGPVPRGGVQQGPVPGQSESRDGVDVVHPRALLVPPHLHVVLGAEEPREAVPDGW